MPGALVVATGAVPLVHGALVVEAGGLALVPGAVTAAGGAIAAGGISLVPVAILIFLILACGSVVPGARFGATVRSAVQGALAG